MPVRVLLIDRSALMRSALRRLLEDELDIVVVAEASSGADAVTALSRHDVAVVVVTTTVDREALHPATNRLTAIGSGHQDRLRQPLGRCSRCGRRARCRRPRMCRGVRCVRPGLAARGATGRPRRTLSEPGIAGGCRGRTWLASRLPAVDASRTRNPGPHRPEQVQSRDCSSAQSEHEHDRRAPHQDDEEDRRTEGDRARALRCGTRPPGQKVTWR